MTYLQRGWDIFYLHFRRYNNLNYISVITTFVLILKSYNSESNAHLLNKFKHFELKYIVIMMYTLFYSILLGRLKLPLSIVTIEEMDTFIKEILVVNISNCLIITT